MDKKYYAFPNKIFHRSNQIKKRREERKKWSQFTHEQIRQILSAWAKTRQPKYKTTQKKSKRKNLKQITVSHKSPTLLWFLLLRFILFLSWEAEGKKHNQRNQKCETVFCVFLCVFVFLHLHAKHMMWVLFQFSFCFCNMQNPMLPSFQLLTLHYNICEHKQ